MWQKSLKSHIIKNGGEIMLFKQNECKKISDTGGKPLVLDMNEASLCNTNYRTALWTGKHLQTTLMNIVVGGDIGLESHENTDQFILVVDGNGVTIMGENQNNLNVKKTIQSGYGIYIPAGYYHNIINTGNQPLKLISTYAPVENPFGTVHATKEIAEQMENY